MKYNTLFLDRDGVLIQKPPAGDYIKSIREVSFLPGVFDALPILTNSFVHLVVTTNQRGIALGKVTLENLHKIHRHIEFHIGFGVIDKFYFCPHEKFTCNCRKPLPGMAHQAQADFPDIVFSESIVVGDSTSDMDFAKNIGATGYRIDSKFALLDFAKQIRSTA